jgi:purine-binding chemotaxis protein CheW
MPATVLMEPIRTADGTHVSRCSLGGKYLTFKLGGEEFGLAILKVREINGLRDITAVPRMPTYMKGVINLRGKVVPVIDLRLKFGLPEAPYAEQTCIILVNVGHEAGLIVDTVSEVLDIPGEQIDPPPALSGAVDTSFILGMGKVGDDVKILLDADRILNAQESSDVSAVLKPSDAFRTEADAAQCE